MTKTKSQEKKVSKVDKEEHDFNYDVSDVSDIPEENSNTGTVMTHHSRVNTGAG